MLKRFVDVTMSAVALLLALPVFLLIALAIKVDSRGPVFYRVRRVGRRGEPFMMLKFRKMHDGAAGIPLTANCDPRLTRVGSFLARARLDELPQFWDVLRARMSIVGPRPEDPSFVALYRDAYDRILTVRPGITGLSQLAFANEREILNEADMLGDYARRILPQKIGLDRLYTDSYRVSSDLGVLWWTLMATALHRPVAVHRATGRMNVRRRARPTSATDPRAVTAAVWAEDAA